MVERSIDAKAFDLWAAQTIVNRRYRASVWAAKPDEDFDGHFGRNHWRELARTALSQPNDEGEGK